MQRFSKRVQMRFRAGALGAVLLSVLLVDGSAAQTIGAWVLPAGTVRLSGGGEYVSFGEVYAERGRERLGSRLQLPLVPERLAPLRPLEAELSAFFAATGAPVAGLDQQLSLGTPDVAVFVNRVRVPLRLDVAFFPRVQVGAGIPIMRGRQLVQRFGVGEPLLAANPNPTLNTELLGRMGAPLLGASPLLPVDESPLGEELQARVRAATGEELQLPTAPSPTAQATSLQALLVGPLGFTPLESAEGLWETGDLEVDAAVALIDPLGGRFAPVEPTGFHLRATLHGGVRFPTGTRQEVLTLVPRDAEVGLSGFRAGGVVDLFQGGRHWWTVMAQQIVLSPIDVVRPVIDPAAPLASAEPARALRWTPADTLQVRVAARVRLAEVFSLGPEYRWDRASASTFAAVGGEPESGLSPAVMNTPGGAIHRLGLTARYTALIPFAEHRSDLPIDVSFSYSRRLGGPPAAPVEGGLRAEGTVLIPLWGGRLRD